MTIALLRVGIDLGCGGALSPIFPDGSFRFVPIPERHPTTRPIAYREIRDSSGHAVIDCLDGRLVKKLADRPAHCDPEFVTFTYGDATIPKRQLATLGVGDLLVFYAGLVGYGWECDPALYLIGFFEIEHIGRYPEYLASGLDGLLVNNAHFYHFEGQRDKTLFIHGSRNSRLFARAARLSAVGRDSAGRPLHVLSPEMTAIFGDFGGKNSVQRSTPRFVAPDRAGRALNFIFSLK